MKINNSVEVVEKSFLKFWKNFQFKRNFGEVTGLFRINCKKMLKKLQRNISDTEDKYSQKLGKFRNSFSKTPEKLWRN